MNRTRLMLAIASTALLAGVGCAHNYPPPPPPPPPPPVVEAPPLVQLGDRNGFLTGRSDGERDAANGLPFHARATRAYRDTPGYDPQLGPFPVYRDAFRNAYLRGYERGYYHR